MLSRINTHFPSIGCGKEIAVHDVSALVDQATYAKYERFVILAALRADPNVRWCPLPTCSNPVKGPPGMLRVLLRGAAERTTRRLLRGYCWL